MTATLSFLDNVAQYQDTLTEAQGAILEAAIEILKNSPAAKQTERTVLEWLQPHQVPSAKRNCLAYLENESQGWYAALAVIEKAFVIQIGLFDTLESSEGEDSTPKLPEWEENSLEF